MSGAGSEQIAAPSAVPNYHEQRQSVMNQLLVMYHDEWVPLMDDATRQPEPEYLEMGSVRETYPECKLFLSWH